MQLTVTKRQINIQNEISTGPFLYLYTDYKAITRELASRNHVHPIIRRANKNKIKRNTNFFFYVISGYYDVSNLVWGCCKILNTTVFFIEIPI